MTASFVVPAGHPALPGHFPGRPIVPGVVLLDEVMALIGPVTAFPLVRFLRPVRPGEPVKVTWADNRFSASVTGTVVLDGRFVLKNVE